MNQFREAITARTRVIEITHITNLTGQILPVAKVVAMAREKGIEVFVDGADQPSLKASEASVKLFRERK